MTTIRYYIKDIETTDLGNCMELGKQMHLEGTHTRYTLDEEMERYIYKLCIKEGFAKSLCYGEEIVGMMFGLCRSPNYAKEKAAIEMLWYVHPMHRIGRNGIKLVKEFEKWAKNRECVETQIGISAGINDTRTCQLLERLGYDCTGRRYAKNV